MTDYSVFTETIRESVSALQVGQDYGLNPGRDGRCACIFCGGDRKDTLKLYNGNRGFYCYRCHRYGDVIALYMGIAGVGFRQAVEDLNGEYGLNLPLKNADQNAMQKAKEQAEKRKRERIAKEQRDRQLLSDACDASDAVQNCDDIISNLAPKDQDEPWRQRFILALRYRDELADYRDRLLDELRGGL